MIKKIDVAIQSYKKPESLILSLLSLHKVAQDHIDAVWINDDHSGGGITEIYKSESLKIALHPWIINVRQNEKRAGYNFSYVYGYWPKYKTSIPEILKKLFNHYKKRISSLKKTDLRYQWAIESTNKAFLFLMHDDITFKKNIIAEYLASISKMEMPGIVGDLGQCWLCPYKASGCEPHKILDGFRPASQWPVTRVENKGTKRACRINEWSALISVAAAKNITEKHSIFFGNYDEEGDIGAYWFDLAIKEGFQFDDPVVHNRDEYYRHPDNGKSGHSVWVDQGSGKSIYRPDLLRKRLFDEFKFCWIWD